MSMRPRAAADDPDAPATAKAPDSKEIDGTSFDNHVAPAAATSAVKTDSNGRTSQPRFTLMHAIAYGLLPCLVVLLAVVAGFLKWQQSAAGVHEAARVESIQTAKDSTVALLSYKPETVEKDLAAARDRLTGDFRDSYSQLTRDVVIPGAKQKQISAQATIPAAASLSANENHSVVMVFVNQTVVIGSDAPSDTASTVKVSMDKVDGRWLISGFEPI